MAATIPTNGIGVDAGLDVAGGNLTFYHRAWYKGVHLGDGTATASELFDDYEEGTWTLFNGHSVKQWTMAMMQLGYLY